MKRVKNSQGEVPLMRKRKANSPDHLQPLEKKNCLKAETRNTLADVKNKLHSYQIQGKKDGILDKQIGMKGLSLQRENCLKTSNTFQTKQVTTKTVTTTEGLANKTNGAIQTKKTSIMTRLSVSKVVKKFDNNTLAVEVKVKAIRPEVKGLERPSDVKGLGRLSEAKTLTENKAPTKPSDVKTIGRPLERKPTTSLIPKPSLGKFPDTEPKSGPLTRAQARKSSGTDTEESIYHSALEDRLLRQLVIANSDNNETLGQLEKSAVKEAAAKRKESLTNPPPGILDVDKAESHDIMYVSDYAFDVFLYLKEREKLFRIPDYMKDQKSITSSMRSVLVDWLVEIQEGFELNHETLYLAVKLLDTYLSNHLLMRSKLQLLGCACMFVASKYEEKLPLSSTDLIDSSNRCFTAEDLFAMELKVLRATCYNLGFPLSYVFMRRFTKCCESNAVIRSLGRYILEMSLMDYCLVSASDSKLAASSLYLAHMMTNMEPWSKTLEYYSGYRAEELYDIVHTLNMTLHKKPKNGINKIQTKYSHPAFGEVSKIPLVPLLCTKVLATQSHTKVLPRE